MSLELIVGLGTIAFLFLYFAFKLEDNHFIFKLLLIFFFCVSILVMPQAVIKENCQVEIANITVTGENSTLEYSTFCIEPQGNAPTSFLRITTWFLRIFLTYCFIYLAWDWGKRSEIIAKMFNKK